MAKYVIVKEAPVKLEKGECVITMPTFVEEVQASRGKAGTRKLTGVNHLRAIAGVIGQKYAPEEFSPYVNIVPGNFDGVAYETDEDLAKIVYSMFMASFPQIVDRYLESKIKTRPFGTKLIYFVGDFLATAPFQRNGIDQIEESDIDVYLGRKEKEVVGKPAITDEEAAAKKPKNNKKPAAVEENLV